MIRLLLPLLLQACGPIAASGAGDVTDGAAGGDAGDSAPPHGAHDTGDSAAHVVVGGLTEGGVRTCADPSARATAPLRAGAAPGDWAGQERGTPDAPSGWGMAIADFDGDGLLDIFLPQRAADALYFGDGQGGFRLAAGMLPAPDGAVAKGASAADYDGDGDLDIFETRLGSNRLLANDGTGRFTDVTAATGTAGPGVDAVSAAWGDMDGDGDLDLFVATMWADALHTGDDGSIGDPNLLYENVDGVFVDRSDRLVSHDAATSFCHEGGWWDVDGQHGPDLYLANDKGYLGYTDGLLVNRGDGTFDDAGAGSGLDISVHGMGLAAADLNGDGVPDFLVSDWGSLALLVSDGAGGWYDAALARGLTLAYTDHRFVAWGAELADLDDDGDDDAPIAFGPEHGDPGELSETGVPGPQDQPDGLWLQGDDGGFTEVADTWGFASIGVGRGMGVADLDGDGWLDFVRRDLFGVGRIDLQACGTAGWLEVALRGPAPNTRGVGARVEIEGGGRRWVRWIEAGSTNVSTSLPPEAHFGLGALDTVDTVRVVWPDGAVQAFADVATHQRVEVWRE